MKNRVRVPPVLWPKIWDAHKVNAIMREQYNNTYRIGKEKNTNNNENEIMKIHFHLQYDDNNDNSVMKIVYNKIILMNS